MAVENKTRRFVLRIDPAMHRKLKIEAFKMSMMLTDFADEVLRLGMAAMRTEGKPKNDGK
jgi:hypothetical protein